MDFDRDVCVVGGCGHVGLPLAIALADAGLDVGIYDIDERAVKSVSAGEMPFSEPDAADRLRRVLANDSLQPSHDPAVIAEAACIVVVIGTPVDEHLNPDPKAVPAAVAAIAPHLRDGQLLVLRSTVYPGVTGLVGRLLSELPVDVELAFCPERIAEGHAFTELYSLPQIVSGTTERAVERASELFGHLTDELVVVTPEEAELAKLFTNTWRYIKFAAANQLYMIANDKGLDFNRIRHAITYEYPRAQDMPGPGFAAGPCLFKDTMQLAAFNNNNFTLGHSSMLVNEGLPLYLVDRIERRVDLSTCTVGILGMAFKAESDDIRSSLSYKLRRLLRYKAKAVLCSDPYVTVDPDLVPIDTVLAEADVIFIGAPHGQYRDLEFEQEFVVDVWDLLGRGVRV